MANTIVRDKDGNLLVGIGDELSWTTVKGDKFSGIIIDMDSNVAEVLIESGRTEKVEL